MPNSFFIILCACAGTGETNSAKVPSTFLNVTIKDSNLSRHVDKVMKTTSKIGDVTSLQSVTICLQGLQVSKQVLHTDISPGVAVSLFSYCN